jgi:hypothetical protein
MKIKMITQSPSGRNRTNWIEAGGVAWAAARGISRDTHFGVILYGEFGTARFDVNGGGLVEWNQKSTRPDTVTRFDDRTIVCI